MQGVQRHYSEIFLHVTWHCLESRPLLHGEIERETHGSIENYCGKHEGVYYLASGGTDTHVHLAIQIDPVVCISEFIGKVKGSSAYSMNKQFGKNTLEWQRGYGVVSFSARHLEAIKQYIVNQREHHQKGTVRETLEKIAMEIGFTDQAR